MLFRSHPGNVWRSLKSRLPASKMPKPYMWMCPLRSSILGFCQKPMHMLLPHELFAAIWNHYPSMFEAVLYGSEQICRRFWMGVRDGLHFRNHPVRNRSGHETNCVPLGLHGDGTPVEGIGKAWSKMVDCFSISSVLVIGPSGLHYLQIGRASCRERV